MPEIPTSFGYNFFLKVVLPGFVAALGFHRGVLLVLQATGADKSLPVETPTILLLNTLFLGILLDMGSAHILRLYEGLRFWPDWATKWGIARLQEAVVAKLFESSRLYLRGIANTGEASERTASDIAHGRVWTCLTSFPMNFKKGTNLQDTIVRRGKATGITPEATERVKDMASELGIRVERPTRMGNLLAAYEGHSTFVYGINFLQIWAHLWTLTEKDQRKEMEDASAAAYSAMLMSFAGWVVGLGHFVLVVAFVSADYFSPRLSVFLHSNFSRGWAMAQTVFGTALGMVAYRLCIALHRAYGSLVEANVDLKIGELRERLGILCTAPVGPTRNYGISKAPVIRCSNGACGRNRPGMFFSVYRDSCPGCGRQLNPGPSSTED